jgi:Family of unknown function (DUF6338)
VPALTSSDLLYFLAFVLPGFLSMQIYSQVRPRQRTTLKDSLFEAVSFSLVNFVILFWGVFWVMDPKHYTDHPFVTYLLVIVIFLVMPVAWVFILVATQNKLAELGILLAASPTAWDHYFRERRPCWVLVHLSDNRKLGGRFGRRSYASSYPDAGHIYIEQLWKLDENGGFLEPVAQSRGIVLRPGDYQMIEFFQDSPG